MMHERVVESIAGMGSVPLFVGAVMAVLVAALAVAEALRCRRERRR